MVNIAVVEPNQLLRMGILALLHSLECAHTSTGIDYTELFHEEPSHTDVDLMLLSVPDAYDQMVELVTAAQLRYAPRRLLLLSESPTLPYSLLNLPSMLAGYISKHASQDVLKTSVMLVLAGGTCFPLPDGRELESPSPDDHPRRRWYDHQCATPPLIEPPLTDRLPPPTNGLPASDPSAQCTEDEGLTQDIIARETDLLNLTQRQYEVLVLLARGHPLKTISRELNISVATAKTHAEALYQRLSVNSRNAAVYAAVSRGATLGWRDPSDAARSPSGA